MLFLPYYELEEILKYLNDNDVSDIETVVSIDVASRGVADKLLVNGISCGEVSHNQEYYSYSEFDIHCDTRQSKWVSYSEEGYSIKNFTITHLVCGDRYIMRNTVFVKCTNPTAMPVNSFIRACKSLELELNKPISVEDEFMSKNGRPLRFD